MRIDAKLPGGGEIHIEKEPLSGERFDSIIGLIGGLAAGVGLLTFFMLLFSVAR